MRLQRLAPSITTCLSRRSSDSGKTRPRAADGATLKETSFDATAGLQPAKWFRVAGEAEYLTPRVRSGKERRFPSIDRLFSDDTAPGLTAQPDLLRLGAKVTFDYANPVGGTLVGGRYSASYDRYMDRNLDRYSFDRVSVDLQQFVPIVVSSRSIVLRARVESVTPEAGNLSRSTQPALGGSSRAAFVCARLRDRTAAASERHAEPERDFMAGRSSMQARWRSIAATQPDNLSDSCGVPCGLGSCRCCPCWVGSVVPTAR
jgi:hypothetical protein